MMIDKLERAEKQMQPRKPEGREPATEFSEF